MSGARPEGLRLCFLGDMNSIHVRKWVQYFAGRGHTVRVISSHYFDPARTPGLEVINLTGRVSRPVADALTRLGVFGTAKRLRNRVNAALPESLVWRRAQRTIEAMEAVEVAGYLAFIEAQKDRIGGLVREFEPDVFQSLRLYPEGLLAQYAGVKPWALMAWGQCLSLWADRYPAIAALARTAVTSSSYYMADNYRDIEDARRYGLPADVPWHLTPSGGGVEMEKLQRLPVVEQHREGEVTFMTFRRIGGTFIDNLPVIRALPILERKHGIRARFVIYGDRSGPYYEQVRIQAQRSGVAERVEVRPPFPYAEVARIISSHSLIVSAATFDGTTNALLETMWLGGIPLNADLPPIREWIEHGKNGYVFDITDPEKIADIFAQAVAERGEHEHFRERNRRIIAERAGYDPSMQQLEEIYYALARGGGEVAPLSAEVA